MQNNKAGNPVKPEQFAVSGEARKKMKKELAMLTQAVKAAPLYRGLTAAYGTTNMLKENKLSVKQAEDRIELLTKQLAAYK